MFPKSKKSLSLSLALLLSSLANASQVVQNADKEKVNVNISAGEANRIAVEGRRIVTIVPTVSGVVTVTPDDASGAAFLTMKRDRDQATLGTVTLFVTDDQSVTYKVVLVPRPYTAEEIILQPPSDKGAAVKRVTGAAEGRTASYQRRVKDLILTMADPALAEQGALDVVDINKDVPLWVEGRLTLVSKYLDIDIVGEKYRLTNVSKADMLLVEQELYRRGVRAVSIKNMTLAPNDDTEIFIVRERKENE